MVGEGLGSLETRHFIIFFRHFDIIASSKSMIGSGEAKTHNGA